LELLKLDKKPVIDVTATEESESGGKRYHMYLVNKGQGPAINVTARSGSQNVAIKPCMQNFSVIAVGEKVHFCDYFLPTDRRSAEEIKIDILFRDLLRIHYEWHLSGNGARIHYVKAREVGPPGVEKAPIQKEADKHFANEK